MNPSLLSIPGLAFAYRYPEVSSTMDVARAFVPQVARVEGGVGLVCAERQTAGRGRQGRAWSGAGKSFMGTFLLSLRGGAHQLSGYSLAVGCAVASALARFGSRVMLKWPNDIVVVRNDQILKLGGILTEVQDVSGSCVVLVGIGLNLGEAPSDVTHASSVLRECGVAVSSSDLEEPLSLAMLDMHRRFVSEGGFPAFQDDWMRCSCLVPSRTELVLDLGLRSLSGIFEGLDSSGAMLLRVAGAVESVHSGHVVSMSGLRE